MNRETVELKKAEQEKKQQSQSQAIPPSSSKSVQYDSKLVEYAKEDRGNEVIRLIRDGISVNSVGQQGRTAIHWAVINNNTVLLQHLIDAGATMQLKDNFGWAPIHYGCFLGSLDGVNAILSNSGMEAMAVCMFDKNLMNRHSQFTKAQLTDFHEKTVFGSESNSYDWLPIHLAALMGHGEICNVITNQFNCNKYRTSNGKTWMDLLNLKTQSKSKKGWLKW